MLPGRIALLLLGVGVLFTALSLAGHALQNPTLLGKLLRYLFDVGGEGNVSTFYSALLLLTCAVLLYVIYRASRTARDRYRFHWLVLVIAFTYLAVDEAARLHELPSGVIRGYLLTLEIGLFGVFVPTPWVLPAGLAVLVMGFMYLPFLFALPRRSAWLFAAAGTVYLAGAVAFEMLAWHYLWMAGLEHADHFSDIEYVVLTSVEELLEMSGAILFIYGLLSHMARQVPVATIRFASELQTKPAPHGPGHTQSFRSRSGA